MSVLQSTRASSSKPAVSGVPAWISFAENMQGSIINIINSTAKSAALKAQEELRQDLRSDSSWAPYVHSVFVEYNEGSVVVYSDSQEVNNLEYGTPEIPMNSKLRPFVRTASDMIADAVTEALRVYNR